MSSLLLDQKTWDLTKDNAGNIALCTDPYAIAQDVATALRTYTGECYYDQERGVPYFDQILGKVVPLSILKAILVTAALQVKACQNPVVYITGFQNRKIQGQVQFTDTFATNLVVTLTPQSGQFTLGVSELGGSDLL